MQFQMISFIMYYHYIFFILRLECLADREIIEIERGDCSNSGNSKNASLCLSYESEIVKFSTKKYKTSYLSHPERPNVSSGLVHFEFGSNPFYSGSTIRYQDLVCRLISYRYTNCLFVILPNSGSKLFELWGFFRINPIYHRIRNPDRSG